jgi:hypothetical protein
MAENGSRQAGHMIVPGYLHGRTIEEHGGPRRKKLRVRSAFLILRGLDVLRSSSVLKNLLSISGHPRDY